jgi:hypothetical protein
MQKAVKKNIQNNPFSLSGDLYNVIDNGYGQNIEDRSSPAVEKSYANDVRIFRIRKNVKQIANSETPYIYEEVYHMQSDHETPVDVRLEFSYNEFKFKVKNRWPIIKYGGLVGYQYELDEITEQEIN